MKKNLFKFIVLSMLGVFLFMFPIKIENEVSIPVALIVDYILKMINPIIPTLLFIIITISGIMSCYILLIKPKFTKLDFLFKTSILWTSIRVIGAIFVVMCYFKVGLSFVISNDNGTFIFTNLLPTLFVLFGIAGFFLPLLINYGLLEFAGVLMSKIMRPVFKLPGRAAIDCITSWLGDGTLGVMLTSKQYEDGYYSEKEATVIATAFSAVSITFCLVVLKQVNLTSLFIPYYATICVVGIICAIIIPRIPPLSKKKDLNINGKIITENFSSSNLLKNALSKALNKAENAGGIKTFVISGLKSTLEMWFTVLPVVLTFGTLALIISNNTPFFEILGKPLVPLLNLFQIPEAEAASKTLFVGFTDMFIPSIIAGNEIQSELTRFIIASVSVTQLIYMSEVGSLMLGSKIPVNFKDLILIFIQRTIISIIVVSLVGRYILGLV